MLKAGWPFTSNILDNQWRDTYIPKSFIDSVAFGNSEYYETKHIFLAEYFSNNGKDSLAFNEYLSLIKTHPYLFKWYIDAIPYLITQRKYQQALELLSSAPNRSDLYTYYYTAGTLNQKIGNNRFAILDFNQAFASTSEKNDKAKALIALFKIYKSTNDQGNAQKTLSLIKGINLNYAPDKFGK